MQAVVLVPVYLSWTRATEVTMRSRVSEVISCAQPSFLWCTLYSLVHGRMLFFSFDCVCRIPVVKAGGNALHQRVLWYNSLLDCFLQMV